MRFKYNVVYLYHRYGWNFKSICQLCKYLLLNLFTQDFFVGGMMKQNLIQLVPVFIGMAIANSMFLKHFIS